MLTRSVLKAIHHWPFSVIQRSAWNRLLTQGRLKIAMKDHGDLNNSHAARQRVDLVPDTAYDGRSLAISKSVDEPDIRERYRPFLLDEGHESDDWVGRLELSTALKMVEVEIINRSQPRLRILVLYGSMRSRSVFC